MVRGGMLVGVWQRERREGGGVGEEGKKSNPRKRKER